MLARILVFEISSHAVERAELNAYLRVCQPGILDCGEGSWTDACTDTE